MSANDRQVAGTHYQGKELQHWDLVAMYGWDYFQAQITKYLMRWKSKHDTHEKRLEDLRKAQHFLEKYIELNATKKAPEIKTTGWMGKPGAFQCLSCGELVVVPTVVEAMQVHGHCAQGQGYVNQD